MVAVSEIPSCAQSYGSLATDIAAATRPWVSQPFIGFAPGENGAPTVLGSPARRPRDQSPMDGGPESPDRRACRAQGW